MLFRLNGSPQKELVNGPGDTFSYTMAIVGDTQDTCRHGGCEKWIQTPKCPDSHSNLIVIFLFGVLQVISEGFHRRRGHLMHASVPRKTWLHLLPRWVNVRRGSYLQLPPVVAVHGPASARVLLSKLALAGSLLTAYQDKALLT